MALNRCENVAPSLAKVYEMKTRMGNAKNAAKLLKRKARVFDLILRDHSRDLINNTQLMMNIMREAFIVLAAARYSTGDFYAVVEECVDKADIKVQSSCDRSMANARVFKVLEGEGSKPWPYGGLSTGGHQVDMAKKLFRESLNILVNQATLRNVINTLFEARVSTMRKSMVIEHMTVPRIQNTISHIKEQLDDMEREDMYRLKKIKQKIMVKNQKLRLERNMDITKESVPKILDREEILPIVLPSPSEEIPPPEPIPTPVPSAVVLPKIPEKTFAEKHVQVNLLKSDSKPAILIEEGTLVVCDILDKKHRCKCGKILSLIDSVCGCEIKSSVIHEGQLVVRKCCRDIVEAACNRDEKGKCCNVQTEVAPVTDEIRNYENQNLSHVSDSQNESEPDKIKRKCPTCQKSKRSKDAHENP